MDISKETASPGVGTTDLSRRSIEEICRHAFGLDVTGIEVLHAELATVCRVDTDRGRVAVKAFLSSTVESDVFRWQGEVQALVARSGAPAAVPVLDLQGDITAECTTPEGVVLVQVSQWLEGTPMSDLTVDGDVGREVGRAAARVARALALAPAPPRTLTHPWELSRARSSIEVSLPAISDPEVRRLLARAAERFEHAVEPYASVLPRSVVHHDLHDSNLLFSSDFDGRQRVSGVLDFGDMLEGWRLAELSVSAAYACRPADDPVSAVLDVVDGWGETHTLTELETQVLPACVAARLAVNAAIWGARSSGMRSEYALLRSQGSLRALSALLDDAGRDLVRKVTDRVEVVG